MSGSAIQDLIPHNHCYGCGPENGLGLRLKSHWVGSGSSVARFVPQPYHCAGPAHFVNGGILATIVDCHCVCTATAAAYLAAGRAIGDPPNLYFATATLSLGYRRPTPIGATLELEARVGEMDEKSCVLACTVTAAGKITVEAAVKAVRVPEDWMQAKAR